MKVYSFSDTTREFIGESNAQIDPKETMRQYQETGINALQFLVQGNATKIAPPETEEGQATIFVGQEWRIVEDHRGKTLYHTDTQEPLIIRELGPLPTNYTEQVPTSTYDDWDNTAEQWQTDTAQQLADAKEQKIAAINHAADLSLVGITKPYPESERLSWDKQEQEARAWLAASSTATPLIDAMISGRGTDKTDQVNRIIQKADAFAAQSGLIFGKRQAYVDQLDAATTVAEVEAITVDYS